MKVDLEVTFSRDDLKRLVEDAVESVPRPCDGEFEVRDYYSDFRAKFITREELNERAAREAKTAEVREMATPPSGEKELEVA